MRLSPRNQLVGTVTEAEVGTVMAEGVAATVLVKSTEVMLGVD